MTYDEAKQQLIDNRELLDPYVIHGTTPAHKVVCSFVSVATHHSMDFHELLFEAIYDRHIDNKEHLASMGLLNSPAIPLVVVLMQGKNNIMSLNAYLAFRNAQNSQ